MGRVSHLKGVRMQYLGISWRILAYLGIVDKAELGFYALVQM